MYEIYNDVEFFFYTGVPVHCQSCTIRYASQIDPKYTTDQRHSFVYAPTNGIQGELSITYYLTGDDYLYRFLRRDVQVGSGNLEGLYFQSGYLTNYSLTATPNSPITVNASLAFFEDMTGTFAPGTDAITNTGHLLNVADCTIESVGGEETLQNLKSFSYTYNAQITPAWTIFSGSGWHNIRPYRVAHGRKTQSVEVVCDAISGELPISGRYGHIALNLAHPYIDGITESYAVSGTMFQKNFQVSTESNLQNTISITNNNIGDPPLLTDSEYIP